MLPLTVIESLRQNAVRFEHRPALLHGDEVVDFGELWRRIVGAASYLSAHGVGRGDRVMLAAFSDPRFVYAYFGTHLLGATAVPFDPKTPVDSRDELIERTQPSLVLAAEGEEEGTAPCDIRAIDEIARPPAQLGEFDSPEHAELADLIFTTGTTGRRKGVRLTQGNLATSAAHINAVFETAPEDVDVVPIPLYHAFGLGRLRCVLVAGGSVVLLAGYGFPGDVIAALERHEATGLTGVPAVFATLLSFGERGLGRFADQLRYIEIGSAPMPLENKRRLVELLPRTSLFHHYGLTEAARSAFSEYHRDHERLDGTGLPAPGVLFEVRNEGGEVLPSGERGALWVGGAHVSPGYWDDPDLTAAAFSDGWARTGDHAHLDEDGYIYLHGRLDDIINVAGTKVAPGEVERILVTHPSIEEALCVGMPDPRGITGDVVRAYVVPTAIPPAVSPAELSRWARQNLAKHLVPARFDFVAELPRTASGKVQRSQSALDRIEVLELD